MKSFSGLNFVARYKFLYAWIELEEKRKSFTKKKIYLNLGGKKGSKL